MTNDDEDPFQPDGFEVSLRDDGFVKVTFHRDDNRKMEVEIPREQLPVLMAALQKKVAPGQVVPIDPASMAFGKTYRTQGVGIHKSRDGGAILTAYVELPDQRRVVAFPLSMSPKDVAFIIERLTTDV